MDSFQRKAPFSVSGRLQPANRSKTGSPERLTFHLPLIEAAGCLKPLLAKEGTYLLKYIHSRIDCDKAGNCAGDKVLVGPLNLKEYHSGRVEGVFTNDLVAVRSDQNGKLYVKKNNLVMKSLECHADTGLCLNDMVLSGPMGKNHYTSGTVTGIYSNGHFFVTDNDDGKTYIRKASFLTKKP